MIYEQEGGERMSKSKEPYTPDNWDLPIFSHGEKIKSRAVVVGLTKGEAYAIADHIDRTLIQEIRNDTDIDSMEWLRNIIHGYEKLCAASGFVGLTESEVE